MMGLIPGYRKNLRFSTRLLDLSGERVAIGVADLVGPGDLVYLDHFVSGRKNRDLGATENPEGIFAHRRGPGNRAVVDPSACWQQYIARPSLCTDGNHVVATANSPCDGHTAAPLGGVLDHHNGV